MKEMTTGLTSDQNRNAFVDLPSKTDEAARTDVLSFVKMKFWTDVSSAGSATHNDLSITALKNFHKDTYLNPYIYKKGRMAIEFDY